jgi:sulfoxide reductase heme-binding subunit YedZ
MWSQIVTDILQKPRLIVGFLAFLLMIPLGITSFDIWKKRLGKNWKRLHMIVYIITPLAVLHYIWSKKGDILSLQGEVFKPAMYGLVVLIFLILRIPAVRKFFASIWPRRHPAPKNNET